jgi:hypothetical protein
MHLERGTTCVLQSLRCFESLRPDQFDKCDRDRRNVLNHDLDAAVSHFSLKTLSTSFVSASSAAWRVATS